VERWKQGYLSSLEGLILKKVAKAVTPYSLVGETGANVPALKHFFRCLETSGTTMTDSKGGVVCDFADHRGVATGYTLGFSENGSTGTVAIKGMQGNSVPVALKTGTWHTFGGTKAVLALCVYRLFDDPITTTYHARFSLGDVNFHDSYYGDNAIQYAGIGMSSGPFHCYLGATSGAVYGGWKVEANVADSAAMMVIATDSMVAPSGTNIKAYPDTVKITSIDEHFLYQDLSIAGGILDPHDLMTVLAYDPSGTQSYVNYNVDTQIWNTYGYKIVNDTYANNTTWKPNDCMRATNVAVYGYALFEFENGLPSDQLLACTWMAQEWKRGNRVIWPGWVGVS